MNPRFDDLDAFTLIGVALRTTSRDGQAHREIPLLWQRVMTDGSCARLQQAATGSRFGVMGACVYDAESAQGWFTYLIAIETPAVRDGLPAGCIDVAVPAGTWAVFPVVGPLVASIQRTWGWIHHDWLPHSTWAMAGGPDLEIYSSGDIDAADYRCEIRIRVRPLA